MDRPKQEEKPVSEVIKREKELILTYIRIMKKRQLEDSDLYKIGPYIQRYLQEFRCGSSFTSLRINSLFRTLRTLMKLPVRLNIDVSIVEKLYKHHQLINLITYYIYQFSDKSVKSHTIDAFLGHLNCSSVKNICILSLYRLNPDYIKENHSLGTVDMLTPEELYYAISTGYFSLKSGTNDALTRLIELTGSNDIFLKNHATNFLQRLEMDGFYTIPSPGTDSELQWKN